MTGDVLTQLATALGVAGVTPAEQRLLLDCARDVAHTSERRHAPLAAFLLGVAVSSAEERQSALEYCVTSVREVLGVPDDQDPQAH